MTCAEARVALLTAEIQELQGHGNAPLARHLAECAPCREAATAILRDEACLAGALASIVPEPDLERVLALALGGGKEAGGGSAEHPQPTGGLPFPPRTPARPRRVSLGTLTLASLAAAAGLAALLLGRTPPFPGPSYTPPGRPTGLGVETPLGQNVAVLETGDPDITVLWLF